MRILTVSAHYPPNFVSGGTLQPQRISQGLRARGHEVSVYAGFIGDRPPLEAWEGPDETGMDVQWLVTSPWIGWADEHNWFNPEVTEHFRAHVERLRPDVVHFHALQSLGAGLLPAARAAGARVVVTMHDFWWRCSRQFLVSPDGRPCCLVTAAGECPCEVDADWRSSRDMALDTLLGSADVVLAPSASATRVLAANGVAPDRLAVDENGLPAEVVAALRAPRQARGPVEPGTLRLLYAGGPNPMKGVDVLLDAAARLAARPELTAWRLSAYGIDEHLTKVGRTVEGLSVEVRDPFDPTELGAVLGAHDVLVLPSVMRETHSLLTREALAAGLPVVCTDTLGPEEVIDHGANGLIVPAADAEALAGALAQLIDRPGLVDRLRAGAARPVAARSLDDQVAGLEATYRRLLEPPPQDDADSSSPRTRVRSVLFVVGIEGAPLRYRAWLPAEALGRLGVATEVRHYRDPQLLALGGTADVVVFYRVPATIQVLELIDALHGAGIPCAFDVDDLIFDPGLHDEIPALRQLPPDDAALWLQGVQRYRTTLEACDAYLGSTAMLVERAAELTGLPSHRFDNGVGLTLARLSDLALGRPRSPGPLRVGYLSGTTTHEEDWLHIEAAMAGVLDRHPDVELWLGGHLTDRPALARFGDRVVRLPFTAWRELPAVLRDLDVNLAPLAPGGRFNEAKSAIKWLEAALCATPTVASPTAPMREAIADGETGLLATSPQQWAEAVERLLDDPAERARLGSLARRRALLDWSPALQGRRYLAILDQILETGPLPAAARRGSWSPVTLDEPPEATLLECYDERDRRTITIGIPGPAPEVGRTALLVDRAVGLARRGVASARAEGVTVTARKAASKVKGRLQATSPPDEDAD